MPDIPQISKEAQVLLKLIRLAIGTEPRRYFGEPVEPFPNDIDWKEVIQLSYKHKVSALAVDGLKSSGYDIYARIDQKELADRRYEDVRNTEDSYTYYVATINTLCQIFVSYGLTPIILKGYGLSQNYPKPSHRGAGDIDIFLIDKEGKHAAEKGDQIAKEILGLEVTKHDTHHSHFTFKGIVVENHYTLLGSNWENGNNIESILQQIITDDLQQQGSLFFPNATFNAIFLMSHIYTHLYLNASNLRQLLDIALLLKSQNINNKDYLVEKTFADNGLKDFSESVYTLISNHLNISLIQTPLAKDVTNSKMLLAELFYKRELYTSGIHIFNHYYRNRWYYSFFCGVNWKECIIDHILRSIKARTNIIKRVCVTSKI